MGEIRCPRCGKEAFIELSPTEYGKEMYYFKCSTCGWKSVNKNDLIKYNNDYLTERNENG